MRTFDILAQWLTEHPIQTPAPYHHISDHVTPALGRTPALRTLPRVLRDLGYQRVMTKYGVWYMRPGETLPGPREMGRIFFTYEPRT
jgi:hypothetical protein